MEKEKQAEILVSRGIDFASRGKHAQAAEIFLEALDLVPGHPVLCFNLALEYLALKEPELALSCLKTSTTADPENPDYWCETGVALFELKDYSGAEDAFDRAVSLGGETSRLWNGLGVLRFITEEYSQAEEFFFRAVKLDPKNRDAWFNLADTLDVLGKRTEAREARREYEKLGGGT